MRRASFDQPNPTCVVKHYNLGALTLDGEAGDVYALGATFPLVESDAHVFVTAGQAREAFSKESAIGFARCIGAGLAGYVSGRAEGSGAAVRVRPLPLGESHAASASTFALAPKEAA